MSASDQQSEAYPSPSAASNNHPFYQHLQQQSLESRTPQQNGRNTQSPGPGDDNTNRRMSEDSQMQAHLDVMGSFGNFGSVPGQLPYPPPGAASSSQVPHGSVAYAQANGTADAGPPPPDKSKQRTKVSRACDECRRKKIRCDAVDEVPSMPCNNCARTAAKCTFSRQPMKRGPSKGYIKELAERLNSLEQQVQPPHLEQQHRYEIQQVQQAMAEGLQAYTHDPRIMPDPRIGDKRTHEVAEGLHPGQQAIYSNVGNAPPPQQHMYAPHMQTPGPTHQQHNVQPFWRLSGSENRHDTVGMAFEAENSTTITNFDWDEAVIDEYYRIIHQTFPLLANNKNRLRQRLAECPASLREAFLAALDCLMRTFPTSTLQTNAGYHQALKRTAELLAKYPFDNPSSHTNSTNLVYLQTLLLMALESDNHGPATIRGQAGPSRAEWLGRAAGVAGQLEINTIRSTSTSVMEGDRDSEDRLARRVWWVLFILDRWHASSTADLLKLPENSVVLLPEDQILLGESTYHLARLSFIIGHLAAILTTTKTPTTDVMAPSNPASSLLNLTLAGEIDRFRESVESVWGSLNLVHMSYHHCHLLIKRLSPTTEPSELVGHAVKVATVLNSRLTPVTPLNHHFGALAAMTLCELCDVPKTRSEAMKGLDQLAQCLGEGRGLAGKLESEGWDGAVRELVKKKRDKMLQFGGDGGLLGLADAAVGSSSHGEEGQFDPTMLTRYGYLTSLGQGVFLRNT
ncbi:unnamed protein product [Zymoseptoria tritici ST99CH_1A5]|uniref:Zn(2)-C6 fungal-type domain-containing protein n=3 Tax=Zymoseptoria tritici TaxID=1047171 RepID=F9X9I7_ZYMTI|nr:uncharacterized protein MYCGRDRAFT_109078 [Zymoseptoria tritici IPO323]EGP88426.1 hypothetical protein MYCGRDRAFT_109078 [Zymoseptoria tritici IPO323]SMQ49853.1 unnamed protein product [Zymoseptoria tritici ST99CH_3D7]SMR51778.1 unnamed protein product [Zymoseptoria tritici ST99CH_3D1]SMY23539.1 unnamed protein product [Zymoseptoria tritici ST99CH_1A5]